LESAELQFCALLQDEGIGTLYERIVKGRMLRQLARAHGYASILEFGAPVTKGFDNLPFLEQGLPVCVADANIENIKAQWRFERQPTFSTLDAAPSADLVWSFARVQLEPAVLDGMLAHARRHVLVFVPNILNPGAPVHAAYHALSRAACHHAEQGPAHLRTRSGLVQLLAQRGVHVFGSGYVDAPPIPNVAISVREVKAALGLGANGHAGAAVPAADPARVWRRMEALTRFEALPLAKPLRPVLGHHVFAIGSV
jgi:hypothetical protein